MDFDIVEPLIKEAISDKADKAEVSDKAHVSVKAVGAPDPVSELLEACKGHPVVAPTKPDFRRLFVLGSMSRHSDTKVLGASYWTTKSDVLVNKKLKAFAEHLLAEPQALPGQYAKALKCYTEHAQKPELIGLPRFFGLSVFGKPNQDIRSLGHTLTAKPTVSLRDLQVRAVKQSLEVLEEWGGCTIIADCGFGKTRVAIGLMVALGRRTLLLCNRDVLMQQWADVLRDLCKDLKVSWIQGSQQLHRKQVSANGHVYMGPLEPADVCICSIETLITGTLEPAFLKTFGTVIVDECHHLAAATLVHALPMVPSRYVVGLSATPDRRDGLEYLLYFLAGPASFVYKRLPSITGLKDTVEVQKFELTSGTQREKFYANGQMAFAEMITFLTEDTVRNTALVTKLIELVQTRKKIIVVSGQVLHCQELYTAVQKALDQKPILALMAGPNVESKLAKDPATKVVFATYSLLEEGYDDPYLDTLVLATPRSRIQQTIGRIERSHEGKLRPLVIDLVDQFSVYPNMWFKRRAFYASRGFLIH